MGFLDDYIHKLNCRGDSDLAVSVQKTADEIGNNYLESFSFITNEVGLLFGNVQSGKTAQVFGIISKAADLGYPMFLILTTNNILLQQQTLLRVKADLNGFCICDEKDSEKFSENMLIKPTIVVIKKNPNILRLWLDIFNNTGFMKGNPLFIIDDEADATSLNTLINRGERSTINNYLDSIKKGASSSIYLQVTGTPQALFLQTETSGWHPFFTYYFSPGNNYIGGNFFFSNEGSDSVILIDKLDNAERNVVIRHLIVSAQIFLSGGNVSNCLIHPSVFKLEHLNYANKIKYEIKWCNENIIRLKEIIRDCYTDLNPINYNKKSFNEIFNRIKLMLSNDECNILILNGEYDVDAQDYYSGCNFIVGGNSLSRGVTFPSLHTIYYTRTSKRPQADTMWQHSRMFGYDRDPGMMRLFIDETLYKLFLDINSTNNSIICQLESGLDNIKIYYPENLSPTRRNVLDMHNLDVISGGTNYFASNPDNNSIEDIANLLTPFDDSESFYQVNLRLILEILTHICPSFDFKLSAFLSIINSMIAENPIGQGILIVRRNRNVTQGTGALLSSNDWELSNKFTDNVVLTMYQINEGNGWKNANLWVPNIKLPNGIIYYNIKNEEEL